MERQYLQYGRIENEHEKTHNQITQKEESKVAEIERARID
jgi:hypothetical protein